MKAPRGCQRAPPMWPALLLLLTTLLHSGGASGVFELQILEFSNPQLALQSGACCGGGPQRATAAPAPSCTAPCRTRFSLCLKEYQASVTAGGCSFGAANSPVLGVDSFTLPEHHHTITLPFTFRWTRSFTLILEAYDAHEYEPGEDSGLIERAAWSGIVEPAPAWHTLRHAGGASLTYRVRVLCQPNYYNTTCTSFCRERDDKFGHYSCSPSGSKRCLPGWQGDNCEIPVCKQGCHPTHGRCDRPGDCECRPGWRGELCAQCQPYPGCKHGSCNGSSWDCTCDTNWGGILCDQDLNYCGTHEPCQHGGTCENTAPDQYLCTCADGFSGADCERVDNPCAPQPCQQGACRQLATPPGFMCSCVAGWSGPLCDIDVDDCASGPCLNGATCHDLVDAYSCECPAGWSGHNCSQDVDECGAGLGPCVNAASCTNTGGGYSCACRAGWTGRDCDSNVDDCAGQCLHGATCIDLVDDYHCACTAGYAGRTCDVDVDDCATRPCRNGGECVDLVDSYRCICPAGFTGTNCELPPCSGRYCQDNRDHCASSPCSNDAPCYNAQSDYYCHCPAGWGGKTCSQRAGPPALPSPAPCSCQHGRCVAPPAHCVCDPGYTGDTCAHMVDQCSPNPCLHNGTCTSGEEGASCTCRGGWRGKTCEERERSVAEWCEEGACLNGGTCMSAGGGGRCACVPGWTGERCSQPTGGCAGGAGGRCGPSPRCGPRAACPSPSACRARRCVCPPAPPHLTRRCLDVIASTEDVEWWELAAPTPAPDECAADDMHNATWWWGCNVCWCAGAGEPASCTRLWCGLPDCMRRTGVCRADEVCVPAAGALCLRSPCAALGECRRVSGRQVEPPPLPAPASCWPGTATPAAHCAAAALELARERLGPGAHVEPVCAALRRALAAYLAPAARAARAELVLLCDLSADDEDLLELALWVAEEEGAEGAWLVAESVRALAELVARRRLGAHPLLAAALRMRPRAPATLSRPALLALLLVPLATLVAGGALALLVRRRRTRAAAARARRTDEDKSNNLQNEENLRRYANPMPLAPHLLYKPQNADARNNTRPPDADCSKREPPPQPARRVPPPETLTVVV